MKTSTSKYACRGFFFLIVLAGLANAEPTVIDSRNDNNGYTIFDDQTIEELIITNIVSDTEHDFGLVQTKGNTYIKNATVSSPFDGPEDPWGGYLCADNNTRIDELTLTGIGGYEQWAFASVGTLNQNGFGLLWLNDGTVDILNVSENGVIRSYAFRNDLRVGDLNLDGELILTSKPDGGVDLRVGYGYYDWTHPSTTLSGDNTKIKAEFTGTVNLLGATLTFNEADDIYKTIGYANLTFADAQKWFSFSEEGKFADDGDYFLDYVNEEKGFYSYTVTYDASYYDARFENLIITENNDGKRSYGVWSKDTEANSTLTIDSSADNMSLTGTKASVRLQGTNDTVTIAGDNTFTNGGNAFILEGVETLILKTDASLVAGSKRGENDGLTIIDADKTETVSDTFFNGGTQVIQGGSINIENADASLGYVNSLTFDNIDTKFETGAIIVTDGSLTIQNGANVRFAWNGIYDKENVMQNYGGVVSSTGALHVFVNGGTVNFDITADNMTDVKTWYIEGYNIHISEGGATANVDKGTVAASSVNGGDLTKTGSGTLIIGHDKNTIEGGLNIAGSLNVEEGTLILGDTDQQGVANIPTSHTAGPVKIEKDGILDVSHHALLKLTNEDNAYDMTIEGTLKIAASDYTGIYKGELNSPSFDQMENMNIYVDGGRIEIYKGDADEVTANTIHSAIGKGGGWIDVAENVTFHSGTVNGVGGVTKEGAGTWEVGAVNIAGTFNVNAGNVVFLDNSTVGNLNVAAETGVHGNGNDLTILNGGTIGGTISGVNTLSLQNGTLVLDIQEGDTPTVRVKTLDLSPASFIRLAAEGKYENVIVAENEIDENWVKQNNQKTGTETALFRSCWYISGDNNNILNFDLKILTVGEYLDEQKKGHGNAKIIGSLIDSLKKPQAEVALFRTNYDSIQDKLQGLGISELNTAIHHALAGELAGNAMRMVMSQPYQTVFQHINDSSRRRSSSSRTLSAPSLSDVMLGQSRSKLQLWFTPYGSSEKSSADGYTYADYKMNRWGIMLGGDVNVNRDLLVGGYFGYADSNVKNVLGRIAADDFSFGAYLRSSSLINGLDTNLMIGFGNQDYSYESGAAKNYFGGDSFYASLEFSKKLRYSGTQIVPLFALDFQKASMNGFAVTNSALGKINIVPGDLESTAMRFGLLGKFNAVRARLQYIHQLSGDDYASSETVFDSGVSGSVRSVQWGKDWWNVGVGGVLYQTRGLSVSMDYDLDIGKRTTSHTGSLRTVLKW